MMQSISDTSVHNEQVRNSASNGKEEREKAEEIDDFDRAMRLQADRVRRDLIYASTIPFLLLVSIAGAPGLFTLSFGGITAYILDLLEAVEGTIICICITYLGFLICLIFGARHFLAESISNIFVFIVMALALGIHLFSVLTHFNVILFDIGIFSMVMLQMVYAVSPLIFSSAIAGIITVEIPEFDVITCFNIVHFIYVYLLCRPKDLQRGGMLQNGFRITRSRKIDSKPLLSKGIMTAIYWIPILISTMTHIAIHWRLPMSSRSRLFQFGYAITLPASLMFYCYESHKDKLTRGDRMVINSLSYFALVILGMCIPHHPIFDELRYFSDQPEPIPSSALGVIGCLIPINIFVQRKLDQFRVLGGSDGESPIPPGMRERMMIGILKFIMGMISAMIATMFALLINLPPAIRPINIIACVALSELYQKDDWNIPSMILLAVMSAFSTHIVFNAFARGTIYHLVYTLGWYIDVTLKDFCRISGLLLSISIVLPALIAKGKEYTNDLLPSNVSFDGGKSYFSTSGSSLVSTLKAIAGGLFSMGSILITFAAVTLELIVMEQDWSSVDMDRIEVYPDEFFFTTTVMLVSTAFMLYRYRALALPDATIMSAVAMLKLLYFLQVDSKCIIALSFFIIFASWPFLKQFELNLDHMSKISILEFTEQAHATAWSEHSLPPYLTRIFPVLASVYLLGTSHVLSRTVLQFVLVDHESMLWQEYMLSIALSLVYMTGYILVFAPEQYDSLRSVLLGCAIVMGLFACEGFGVFSFDTHTGWHQIDNQHSLLMRGHSQFFMIISTIMTVIAWLKNVISLQNNLSCLLYSVIFGYVSTKAMMDWTFPISHHTHPELIMGPTEVGNNPDLFPFLFLFVSKTINTFVALSTNLNRQQDRRGSSSRFVSTFWFALAIPWVTFINAIVMGCDNSTMVGIIWATIVSSASLTVSFRAREILQIIEAQDDTTPISNKRVAVEGAQITVPLFTNRQRIPVTTIMAANGIIWSIFAILFHTTALDADLVLPAVALLLLACSTITLPAVGKISPIMLWSTICTLWWYGSLVYHIFIMHYEHRNEYRHRHPRDNLESTLRIIMPYSAFGWDSNVSIWSNDSIFIPMLNLFLALIPMPGLLLTLLGVESVPEEILFVFGFISIAAIVGGSIDAVRYLGLLGALLAMHRSYIMSQRKASTPSDRYL